MKRISLLFAVVFALVVSSASAQFGANLTAPTLASDWTTTVTSVRVVEAPPHPPTVTLTVGFDLEEVLTWAWEEELPVGLDPIELSISHDGEWDPVDRKIRWGLFYDTDEPIVLSVSYQVTGDSGPHTISGVASIYSESLGGDFTTTGDTEVNIPAANVPDWTLFQ